MTQGAAFDSHFHMPIIAPAPPDFGPNASVYYSQVKSQADWQVSSVTIAPELVIPPQNPGPKGLKVTIEHPAARFSYTPGAPISPPPPQPPLFGSLFAMTGGEVWYRPSTAGLNSLLPAPFSAHTSPLLAPAPSAGVSSGAWGTVALKLWPEDVVKLSAWQPDAAILSTVFYVGVDQASLAIALKPCVEKTYPLSDYDASIAKSVRPSLQDVMETVRGSAYGGVQPYATLVADHVAAVIAGTTGLLTPGGAILGEAVKIVPSGSGQPSAEVQFWFLDGQSPQRFVAPQSLLASAVSHDF